MIEKNNIKTKLIEIFKEVFENIDFRQYQSFENIDLIEEFGVSSITLIALIVQIEESFMIAFPDDCLMIDNFRNIDQITDTIYEEILKTHD